jgi:diacylglycerol kinase family enzyme
MNMAIAGAEPDPVPEPPDDSDAKEASAKSEARAAELKSMLSAFMAMQRNEPPRVEVRSGDTHLHLPESMVQVTNAVPAQEAPSVTVNSVQGPAPVVNVTTPEVKVDVAAPEVHFEAVMPAVSEMKITGMPERVTDSSVKRDGSGNIISTTQTERDG